MTGSGWRRAGSEVEEAGTPGRTATGGVVTEGLGPACVGRRRGRCIAEMARPRGLSAPSSHNAASGKGSTRNQCSRMASARSAAHQRVGGGLEGRRGRPPRRRTMPGEQLGVASRHRDTGKNRLTDFSRHGNSWRDSRDGRGRTGSHPRRSAYAEEQVQLGERSRASRTSSVRKVQVRELALRAPGQETPIMTIPARASDGELVEGERVDQRLAEAGHALGSRGSAGVAPRAGDVARCSR